MVKFENGGIYYNKYAEIRVTRAYKRILHYKLNGISRSSDIHWTGNRQNPKHPIQYVIVPDGTKIYATNRKV